MGAASYLPIIHSFQPITASPHSDFRPQQLGPETHMRWVAQYLTAMSANFQAEVDIVRAIPRYDISLNHLRLLQHSSSSATKQEENVSSIRLTEGQSFPNT